MNSERLDNLFGEIRNEATETSVTEVGKWIAVSAASAGLFGLLSQFKLPLLLTKKFIIMTSIITTLGVAATAIILSNTNTSVPAEKQTVRAQTVIAPQTLVEDITEVRGDGIETDEISPTEGIEKIELLAPKEICTAEPEVSISIPPVVEKEESVPGKGIERSLSYFNKIKVSGAFQVFISQGESESVVLKTNEETADRIATTVKNEVLQISKVKRVKDVGGIQIYVTVTDLNEINISGASQIQSVDLINAPDLKINSDGAASLILEIRSDALKVNSSGAANVTLSGTATSVNMDISGASNVSAFELNTKQMEIKASGAANIQCTASEVLIVVASDASQVLYDGIPASIDTKTSVASHVGQR